MKQGLGIGDHVTLTIQVTKDMFAQFEGEVVHPVFSTVSMVYYMEWASRKLIIPFFEEYEEGMGGRVEVEHVGPSKEGDLLIVMAKLKSIKGKRVVTEVEINNGDRLVGKGEVVQFVLSKAEIDQKIHAGPTTSST